MSTNQGPLQPLRGLDSTSAGPPQTRRWETRGNEQVFPKFETHLMATCETCPRTSQGPAYLPRGSVSFWSAFLCTMAGYVMVSLLLCSFRTTDRPVLCMRTVVIEERKTSTRHWVTAVSDGPEASGERERQEPSTHLQWGHRLALMCAFQKEAMSLLLLSQTFFTCWDRAKKRCSTISFYYIHSFIHSLDSFYYFISLHHIFILWFLPFFEKGVSYPLKHFPQNPNIAKLYQLLSDFFKA